MKHGSFVAPLQHTYTAQKYIIREEKIHLLWGKQTYTETAKHAKTIVTTKEKQSFELT